MKTDKLLNTLTYQKVIDFRNQLDEEVFDHLIWMILQIPGIEDTRKANRWLGFIHGQLVALTDCTVEELRNMIREED